MPIDPDLDRVREVRADLDKAGAEVLVPQVEVETGDPPVGLGEGEPRDPVGALALVRGEHVLILLRDADRGDPRPAGAGLRIQVPAHHLDLAVTPGELHHRDLVGPRERVDPTPEPGPDLLQDRRRGDRQPQVPGHERDDLPPHLQGRHIPVEIDPIQTLDVQPDVTLEQIIDRHRRNHPPA